MKNNLIKNIIICLSVYCSCLQCFASNAITPQWAEFCPPKYINAVYIKPLIANGSQNTQENNYWYRRKIDFIRTLSTSEKTLDTYNQIRIIEENKSKIYFEQKKLEAIKNQSTINNYHSSHSSSVIMPNTNGNFYRTGY